MIQKKSIGYNRSLPLSYIFKDNIDQFNKFIPNSNHVFLSTGRCAIKLAIRTLKLTSRDEILLPSYHCPEGVLRPIQEEGINIKFFKIKKNLSIDINDIKNKISDNTKALFVIHYFGFPQCIEEISELCKNEELFLIEDCAHAFLSKYHGKLLGSFGDLSIFTYRKTIPVPDGALLVSNNSSLIPTHIDKKINLIRTIYSIIETSALILANVHNYFSLITPNILIGGLSYTGRKLIKIYSKPTNPSHIFESLVHKFDLEKIISIKRENFKYLLKNLTIKDIKPLYTELPDGVCPLWFPILVENRDLVRKKLKKNEIFTPIFWKLPKEVDKREFQDSWGVSNKILSIPLGSLHEINIQYIIKILNEISDFYEGSNYPCKR